MNYFLMGARLSAMATEQLETDYLVIGTGAMGLAFADELLQRDASAHIVLVDRRAKPGGHWNDAYAFVSLHQPAAYYGVNSMPLGSGGSSLATGDEVLSYFGQVMQRLLASGRVRHFGMCEYEGEGRFRSRITPSQVYEVHVRRKIVDATYMHVEVPSTTPPKYPVAPEIELVPINGLVEVHTPRSGYVIIGAGKTGIDAVLFLLNQRVDPNNITWIMSNDAWLLRRERVQPGRMTDFFFKQLEICARASTLDEVVLAIEAEGIFARLDPSIAPTKYRCATVSGPELELLRRVRNVVRLGRVIRIDADAIVLERGTLPADPQGVLYVDCTADGLAARPARPVFAGAAITLQSVLVCQQVLSAALIAYLETRYHSDAEKNALSQVIPHPEWTRDYVNVQLMTLTNIEKWQHELGSWLRSSRLCFLHHESMLDLLVTAFRSRHLERAAVQQLRRIHAQEFPS